ncbi:TonB-dependent receptor [Alteromonas sediminis]|uniref:TonB-dependent receptor n=1 Tax=Alteromonas sediminis TaxID=2259342 RepID=A0A3N5Z709_9ALTE|nr:TonB-dependent receptor [Alteromonas sediminis]RPJ66444.1 TonB-dependent receptor [Alteromonas sediminis]
MLTFPLPHKYSKSLLALAVSGLIATPVFAQEEAEDDPDLERIMVTATKRATSIQNVPFSINAQTQKDIERSGANSLEDLTRNVAGVSIQNLGPGQSQVAIRGVSAGQVIRDQPGVKEQVGVYLDESVISLSLFTPDLDLYDLARVETLRGPQGTLFGSGSIGGTLRYITNQPVLDFFEASVEANLNTLSDGDTGGHIKAMVNSPLVEDKLAMRAVVYRTDYAGFVDALGENGARVEDVNGGDRTGGRIALVWQATDELVITPRIVFQELDMDGYNRQEVYNLLANPYTTTRPAIQLGEREQYLLQREGFNDDTFIADVTAVLSTDNVDYTFVYSYTDRDILVSRDASALTGSVTVDLFTTDAAQVVRPSNLRDRTEVEQDTVEIRAASTGDDELQWLFGAFYSDTQRTYTQRLPTPGYDALVDASFGEGFSASIRNGVAPADSPYAADLPYDLEQMSVFGELTYEMTDKLDVTFGSRWYDYEESRRFTSGGLFSAGDDQVDSTTSDGFNSRLIANYELNDTVSINGQVSQGFRLGGVNDPLNVNLCEPEDVDVFGAFQDYDDEKLINYEVGIKSISRGWTANFAAFYNDIEDLQVTLDAGSCSSRVVFNVPEATSSGVEFEITRQATENLFVSFAGSWLESEFDSTVIDGFGNVLGGVESGNRLASVPELQFALSSTYNLSTPLFGSEESYLSASWQYVGDRYTQPSDQVPGAGAFVSGLPFGGATGAEVTNVDLELGSYNIVNLSAGFVYDEWEALVYINNAFDENALLSFDRERGGRARLAYRTNQPRTFGVTVRMFFE